MTAQKTDTKVIQLRPHQNTHTRSDTILVSPEIISRWKAPPFQRPLRVNDRVRALVDTIKQDGGVIPGVITLGVLGNDTYLLDGQHRAHAFLLAELEEGFVDIRIHHFSDMGDMGEEFVNLNSRLVTFRPDDILRGLEEATPNLRFIRQKCPFVGYDMIRRSDRAPILSMSTLLRCWAASGPETPANGGTASTLHLAQELTKDEAENLVSVLSILDKALGRDESNARLWLGLNLTLTFWMWRRTVITQYSPTTPKLTKDQFQKCMMSVAADPDYADWLVGRRLSERDRSPAYAKLKSIFAKRIEIETGKKPRLPQPPWARGHV